jgi:hypothetical protein
VGLYVVLLLLKVFRNFRKHLDDVYFASELQGRGDGRGLWFRAYYRKVISENLDKDVGSQVYSHPRPSK